MIYANFSVLKNVNVKGSVVAVVAQNASVAIENLRFRDESNVFSVGVNDGEIPGSGVVKSFHDVFHIVADGYFCDGGGHEFADKHAAVEVRAEHDVSDVVEEYDSEEASVGVDHGEEVAG